jgi:uracil-DNA glycosylase
MEDLVTDTLDTLLDEIRACRVCEADLPLGPRPVVVANPSARILIIGQAPGTKVHESGIPWNDRSGDTLRGWLEIDKDTFYDPEKVAIVPMGFCYPGVLPRGGDAPPRPDCVPLWHGRLGAELPNIKLTLLAGMYAQAEYLGKSRKNTLTATVEAWREFGPEVMPLPHPSWRSENLLRKNPWFEAELLPDLRARVRELI